jgi:hypothetical protein
LKEANSKNNIIIYLFFWLLCNRSSNKKFIKMGWLLCQMSVVFCECNVLFFLSSFVFCGIKLDLYLCNFNLTNAPKSVFWSNAQKNLHLYPYREHSSAGIKTSRLSKKITSLQLACGNNVLM